MNEEKRDSDRVSWRWTTREERAPPTPIPFLTLPSEVGRRCRAPRPSCKILVSLTVSLFRLRPPPLPNLSLHQNDLPSRCRPPRLARWDTARISLFKIKIKSTNSQRTRLCCLCRPTFHEDLRRRRPADYLLFLSRPVWKRTGFLAVGATVRVVKVVKRERRSILC